VKLYNRLGFRRTKTAVQGGRAGLFLDAVHVPLSLVAPRLAVGIGPLSVVGRIYWLVERPREAARSCVPTQRVGTRSRIYGSGNTF